MPGEMILTYGTGWDGGGEEDRSEHGPLDKDGRGPRVPDISWAASGMQ